jgi:hypothetical protein
MRSPFRRLKAYILAADPTWIEASLGSYYSLVEEIIVSYDIQGRGYTGLPLPLEACLQKLRSMDCNGKMRYCPGSYARLDHSPMDNETHQRRCAIEQAAEGADWILQIDTDELLPSTQPLLDAMAFAEQHNLSGIEWPMRVLYQRTRQGRYLEVCATDRCDRFEYPGAIAIRPHAHLLHARVTGDAFLRVVVRGDRSSLQLSQDLKTYERRAELISASEAILHNSWARTPKNLRMKLGSWSHNSGLKSWLYYYCRWLPAPYTWRAMRDFHPFARGLWPALKPCDCIPRLLLEKGAGTGKGTA